MSVKNTSTRLTVDTLKNMAIGDEIWCHVADGLHVRRKATGWKWLVYYRDSRGDRRRPCIGNYPAVTLEPAREMAKKLLQAVARGEDPSAEKREARKAPRVGEMVDKFLAESCTHVSSGTLKLYTRVLNTMRKTLGNLRAADVLPADVTRALSQFNGGYDANNGRRVFRRMWNVAQKEWRYDLPANPVAGTRASPHKARRRKAEAGEMPAIAAALEDMRAAFPAHVALIWCLAFTGARASELTTAKHEHIISTPQGKALRLTQHKTARMGEDRVIELPKQALDEIARMPTRADGLLFGPSYDYVYRLWCKVRATAGCPDLRLHDLRRTWASHGKSAGASLDTVGELLGHAATQTTAGYAYLFEDARAAGAQALADSVAASTKSRA